MGPEYTRNRNKNYITVKVEGPGVYHEICMLKFNSLRTLLGASVRLLDADEYMDYEVSGYIPITTFYDRRRMDADAVKRVIDSLYECSMELENYLLSLDGLVLEPQFIYIEPTVETIAFIFNPGERPEFTVNLQALLKFLMDKADSSDSVAVELAYGLYTRGSGDNIEPESLKEYLYGKINTVKTLPLTGAEPEEEETSRPEIHRKKSFLERLGIKKKNTLKEQFIRENIEEMTRPALPDKGKYVTTDLGEEEKPEPVYVLEEIDAEGSEPDRFTLTTFPFVVGKQTSDVDRFIAGPAISRFHARFLTENGQVCLQDMNSRNGTFVNNAPLGIEEKRLICDGDIVAFANRRYQVQVYPDR